MKESSLLMIRTLIKCKTHCWLAVKYWDEEQRFSGVFTSIDTKENKCVFSASSACRKINTVMTIDLDVIKSITFNVD